MTRLSRKLLVSTAMLVLCQAIAAPQSPSFPHGKAGPGYVADHECATCHKEADAAWQGSKHHLAMQPATSSSVLGNFDAATFARLSDSVEFQSKSGHFSIVAPDERGERREFPVTYTFGVQPLQQYLVPMSGGRLQAVTIAWDTVRHRWFDLQAGETVLPGEPLHWTGRYQNWNLMCAECHTTGLRKNYDQEKDVYRTTWAAPNVGCQACHGPGLVHVTHARRKTPRKSPGYGLPMAAGIVDQCAVCHARRTRLREETQAGGEFLDNFQPDTLRPDLYHADGQQLAEVFEYGSFRQSRMYQAGVICTDCHSAHSGKLLAEGNALCTRCHSTNPNPAFPGLKARNYDGPEHHFHASGESGSQCVDCHMPSTNYMVVHGRRDHAIRVPRPDLSLKLQTPNACNSCHRERGSAWAVAALERHFGERRQPPHYGEILAAARAGRPGALGSLAQLSVDLAQPAIVRATATEVFGQTSPQRMPVATLRDPDPAVRSVAAMVLGAWTASVAPALLMPLLEDPVRAVRMAAARSLLSLGEGKVPPAQRPALHRSLAEFIGAQNAMADMPSAQLNLASFQRQRGKPKQALIHYQRALSQDPAFLAARLELADFLADENRFDEAEKVLRSGMQTAGNEAELRYALGQLLARQGKRTMGIP